MRGIFGIMHWIFALVLLCPVAAHAQTTAALPSEAEAPIAILIDLSSGQVLHQRNPNRRFVPASITKVMTVYQAFRLIEQGELQLQQRFAFNRSAFAQWGGVGSTMFLNAGESPLVRDLLMGITTVSANDASVVLAQGAAGSLNNWLDMMNATARQLRMRNSHFGTPNGWPDEGRTFTTAEDLAILGTALVREHPELYRQFFGHREFSYNGITQPNYEPLTGRIEGGDGIKTGFTNEAGFGLLGTAERDGRRLMLVVAGAESSRMRARAARNYMEWGFQSFDSLKLFRPGEIIGEARVQGGNRRTVSLSSPYAIAAAVPKSGDHTNVRLNIVYDGPLRAPVAAGDQVATLEISAEGFETSRVPLYAEDSVDQAGPIARIVNGVIGWFL